MVYPGEIRNLPPAASVDELRDRALQTVRRLGFDHFMFAARRADKVFHGFDLVLDGAPSQWWAHYVRMGYPAIDPIIDECITRISNYPFVWRDDHFDTPARKALREDARQARIASGASLSVGYGSPFRAVLTLTSETDGESLAEQIERAAGSMWALGVHVHESLLRLSQVEMPRISSRERECLQWSAAGKTAEQTAQILAMSPSTARFHLENARRKLQSANLVQAVARAVRLGLIDP
jgi:DNA-binding CsgD family transcriptional regulator